MQVQSGDIASFDVATESTALYDQGLAYIESFECSGNLQDLERAITSWQCAVDMTPDDHVTVSNLGTALMTRFEQFGSPADLDAAILHLRTSANLIPDGDPQKPVYLNNIGNTLSARFDLHNKLLDLEEEITWKRKTVDLVPDRHPDKPGYLNSLGNALGARFDRIGSLLDLEEAISQKRKAVNLAPDSDPDKPIYLNNLAVALESHFKRYNSLSDLEELILQKKKAVNLTPDDHPNKPAYLNTLGNALEIRFYRLGLFADLDEAISQMRKAVQLTPDDHPTKPMYLSHLGIASKTLFDHHGSLPDLEEAILQKRKAVELTPDGHPERPRYLSNLGIALENYFAHQGWLPDLEEAIQQTRKAVDITPDGHSDKAMYINNLGIALKSRFDRRGSLSDLEEAIKHARKSVELTADDHKSKPGRLSNLGNALENRFNRIGSLPDLDEAILQKRKAVSLTPDSHPDKSGCLSNLGIALQARYHRHGSLQDLEEAISQQQKAVELTPDGHPDKPNRLNNLGNTLDARFGRRGLLSDLEEAISHMLRAIELTPRDHPNEPHHLNNVGNTSESMFHHRGITTDLDNSILQRQNAVNLMPRDHPDRAPCLRSLSRVLRLRFEVLGDQNDLQQALLAAQESAISPAASATLRIKNALFWAECCVQGSISPLPAFELVINLLPRSAWLGIGADDQYFHLAKFTTATRDAIAAAIDQSEYATAIEWAEQGRSIVWQNLLSLRTPLDALQAQYPELAMRLREVLHHLERPEQMQNAVGGSKWSKTADNQIALAMERDRLVDEIRGKPGFESIMKPKSLGQLAPAVRDGPVVLLNLGNRRCDALVLLPDDHGTAHTLSIPLKHVTLQNTAQLSKRFVDLLRSAGVGMRGIRKPIVEGLMNDPSSQASVFAEILKVLWLDYVKPVIDALNYSVNLDSPPRLWWSTTGELAFLPLHAAGLYDVEEVGHKLSDYVVSSYTPTITNLLDHSLPNMNGPPKILTVAMSKTPRAKSLPMTEGEVDKLHHLATNLSRVNLKNETATKRRVLQELGQNNWAHLACHGKQVGGKPMESGLLLHDEMLKLSEISKTRLPEADFAFLSACETAVGDGGVPEESAHLAAGLLFAGYRGVVATMWSIRDHIAPRVAEDFYRYLFRHGQPMREEAAYALHRAVRHLQEAGEPFTSWVPFVYIGR